jgi:DNA segregation ATPase FtsK/SpoIIIE-like protein
LGGRALEAGVVEPARGFGAWWIEWREQAASAKPARAAAKKAKARVAPAPEAKPAKQAAAHRQRRRSRCRETRPRRSRRASHFPACRREDAGPRMPKRDKPQKHAEKSQTAPGFRCRPTRSSRRSACSRCPRQPEDLITAAELTTEANLLLAKLADFGIDGRVTEIHPGPVVTTFEFAPAAGVKVNQIVSREDDLALALRAQRIASSPRSPEKARSASRSRTGGAAWCIYVKYSPLRPRRPATPPSRYPLAWTL